MTFKVSIGIALGLALNLLPTASSGLAAPRVAAPYDMIIENGMIYDGSGRPPYRGMVAIRGDRIGYVGPAKPSRAKTVIDARGQAVAPGFINMLSHAEESLFVDGRGLSDLTQGVTLEIFGEASMGPLSADMKAKMLARQGDVKFPVTWTTLGGYLTKLAGRGIGPNIASFVGEGTVRTAVLGEYDVSPTPAQLDQMRGLVRQAMEEGALGVTTALIYPPLSYAKTPELIEMAKVSARCGGIYTAHMRSEADWIEEAIAETVAIARASGAPAEIYHLKIAGRDNWPKVDRVLAQINAARAAGTRITADMYTYDAGATGFDAAMPPWVHNGGFEQWIARLKDPAQRARVIADMRVAHPSDWENLFAAAGPDNVRVLAVSNPALRPFQGKTIAEIARTRGVSPEDAVIDLQIEDHSRILVSYTLMSEANIRRQLAEPWVSFASDAAAEAPEGVFLQSSTHPRTYGNFARVFAKYSRDDGVMSIAEAVRRLTALPAANLSLKDRGRLVAGNFADVVVFDPAAIQDHATYDRPHALSTGVADVIVNGRLALRDGVATGAATGRVVRGRAWVGAAGGGCRRAASDWSWAS